MAVFEHTKRCTAWGVEDGDAPQHKGQKVKVYTQSNSGNDDEKQVLRTRDKTTRAVRKEALSAGSFDAAIASTGPGQTVCKNRKLYGRRWEKLLTYADKMAIKKWRIGTNHWGNRANILSHITTGKDVRLRSCF